MRILLTGGCGFIGVNLCRVLQAQGHGLRVVDDFSVGQPDALASLAVDVIQGDVRQPDGWASALHGVDAVVHLAAATGIQESIADPRHDFDINAYGTLQVLLACRHAGVRRVVFASTNALLGHQPPPMTERVVPSPLAPYAASKLAGEGYCLAFRHTWGLETVVLRFANVYGPFSTHKSSVVHRFIKDARAVGTLTVYGDGEQTRDFVHVQDLASAVAGALMVPAPGAVYQIGSGQPTSVRALAALLAGLTGARVVQAPPRPSEVRHSFVDVSLARAELGYVPRVALADGVADVWSWFAQGAPRDWPLL